MSLRQFSFKALVLVCAAGTISEARAEVTVSNRLSTQRYGYLVGHGPSAQLFQDDVTLTSNDLLAADSFAHSFSDSSQDYAYSWYGEVSGELSHSYSVLGALNDVQAISSEGSTVLTSGADVDVISQLDSANPGNELILNFEVPTSTPYNFSGDLNWGGYALQPGNQTQIDLQFFNGLVWVNIFTTTALPDGKGHFDTSGTLDPGSWRLYSILQDGVRGTESKTLSYDYALQIVPEPATLTMLASALLLLRRRRGK